MKEYYFQQNPMQKQKVDLKLQNPRFWHDKVVFGVRPPSHNPHESWRFMKHKLNTRDVWTQFWYRTFIYIYIKIPLCPIFIDSKLLSKYIAIRRWFIDAPWCWSIAIMRSRKENKSIKYYFFVFELTISNENVCFREMRVAPTRHI